MPKYGINSSKELKQCFKENNIDNSGYLSNKGKNYWKKELESIINQLIIKYKDINKLEKDIEYKIPEEYKTKFDKKAFYFTNQI